MTPQIAEARQQYTGWQHGNLQGLQPHQMHDHPADQHRIDLDCLANLINVLQIMQEVFDTYGAITFQTFATAKAKAEQIPTTTPGPS
jgi:hypothetical protein